MKRFSDFIKTNLNESLIVYRGIPVAGKDKDRMITWVSTSKEHATMYANGTGGTGEVLVYKISKRMVPIDLHFRAAETFVTYEDIRGRINDAILERFENKQLTEDQTVKLLDSLRALKLSGTHPVHEWMHKPQIIDVIKKAGFNCIVQHEGLKAHVGDVVTYGILDKSLLS